MAKILAFLLFAAGIHPLAATYGLRLDREVHEAGIEKGTDPYWWLNSGAYFRISDGAGYTNWGELADGDEWKDRYGRGINAELTDGGKLPQNIFRLFTKPAAADSVQGGYFWIEKVNRTDTSDRDESDGILLINRHEDSDHLYYAGIRVDGNAVIKKKNGREHYRTLGLKKLFSGSYHRTGNPNLIPERRWIGLATVVRTLSGGSVRIELYMDEEPDGRWRLILEAADSGEFGRIYPRGNGGIRTDYMDAAFRGYLFYEIPGRADD